MAEKPTKRRVSGGRTTPKGTHPEGYRPDTVSHTGHQDLPPSPPWVAGIMFGLLGSGIAVLVLNYSTSFWDTSNGILLLGLALVLGGIIAATQYR